jgi:hypothetical protein
MPRLNQTSATPQPQSMKSKHRPSRYPSHHLRRQSQHKPSNLPHHREKGRSYHGHMDQDCQGSGHIPARNGTTPTLRSRARTKIRRDLVGHSQCPNIKTATRNPSRQATQSSQETPVITNHLAAAENTTVSARRFTRKNRRNETENFQSGLPSGPIGYSGRFGSRPDKGSGGRFNLDPNTSSSGPNPEQPGTGKNESRPRES